MRKSGTTEEYDERDQLLTDIKTRMDDFAQNNDVRKDAAKRKQEGIENSGTMLRRMAMAELTSQGEETGTSDKRRKKSKPTAPVLDVASLINVIKSGIDEKQRREARATEVMLERLRFDQEQALRQEEQHASNQRFMRELVAALVKKSE